MSVLNFPRVYFSGEIAWDPVTTNNYLSAAPNGQPPTEPNNGPVAEAGYDEGGARTQLDGVAVTPATVDAFRKAAAAEIVPSGNWNPHGTYRSPFFDARVSGVDLGNGLDRTDSFVSAPVNFTGMLVDCEPYGAFSSQLFFDEISLGILGGCRILGKRVTRISDRFINFNANPFNNMIAGVASVMWQTCFPKQAMLDIDVFDSKVLSALDQAMDQPDVLGLMLRFVTYRTVYYDDPTLENGSPLTGLAGQHLMERIQAGGFQPNPARSLLRGTVGLWLAGECPTEASDRTLIATQNAIPGQLEPQYGGPIVGTVFASFNAHGIALDLSNAIPCTDRVPNKFDLGPLQLIAVGPPPQVASLLVAEIQPDQYDRAAFDATSGIVDIPLDPGLIASIRDNDLKLRSADGTVYAVEQAVRPVPMVPNLYVNQGEAATATVQVYVRGEIAGAGLSVTMSNMLATDASGVTAQTNEYGQIVFNLDTAQPTVAGYVFQNTLEASLPIGNGFSPMTVPYMYLRVLPSDSALNALPCTWENVYSNVLCNWKAMAPCMDNWLDLADKDQVLRYGVLIRKLTDPASFESFRYMPVTRDLTVGQRNLLYRFLGTVAPSGITAHAPVATTAPDAFALSRSMRAP